MKKLVLFFAMAAVVTLSACQKKAQETTPEQPMEEALAPEQPMEEAPATEQPMEEAPAETPAETPAK
ncbi:MAG: hypothetical protein LBF08_01685 [Dysgonamonadaceae bacterium]|jgi:protein involved in sex pheromone biosynthesis|nr:hypothetical protein [Dysgonamonadaceae bacterium]